MMNDLEPYLLRTYKRIPIDLARGEDVYVWDTAGRRYLDFYAGHAVASTGHCHPRVVKAIQEQAAKLLFYSNVAGLPLRVEAAKLLIQSAPPGFTHAFFANSGAEANEAALKMARKHTGRAAIVAMQGGFHGRTAGAMSVTGVERYRVPPLVPGTTLVPFGDLAAATAAVNDRTAAVILEPIQSMAGVKTASAEYFQGLRGLCDRHEALLIYDEVQTGIGRTGRLFFAPRHDVVPDLITLAKGIASGVPLSAVLVSKPIAERVSYGEHGATFGAGPLAMAAMKATLEVMREERLPDNARDTGAYLAEKLRGVRGVLEVRGLALMAGIKVEADAGAIQKHLLAQGVIVGTADEPGVLRLLPPLTLTRAHVDEFIPHLIGSLHHES
ncbi:MAG: aminotransferase class III-fold pyridoxal phosphate-dependent enzyme [Planctomycetes bacterium]|nr:aminotransferase class III-fold pyridoxal phosphate-dependent enzyme [Planctomycetota bacterium]